MAKHGATGGASGQRQSASGGPDSGPPAQSRTPLATIHASHLRPTDSSNEFVSPAAVREAITETSLFVPTELYFITDVDGSGRAQLCAWLRDQLHTRAPDDTSTDCAVIHIVAADGDIKTFLNALAEPLNIQLDITAVEGVTPENLVKTVLWRLQDRDHVAGFSQAEREQLAAHHSGIDLFDVLTDHITRSVAGDTQLGAIPDLLPEETYRRLLALVLEVAPTERKRAQLVSAIHDGLRYALGIESVHDLLDEVCRRYRAKGVRPVVICADFSTVSPLLRRKLLWYWAKSKGEFDVVLGGSAA